MDKKKASMHDGAEKVSDNESLAETQDSLSTGLGPDCHPHVVIKHLKKARVGCDIVAKFTAIVCGDASISNFAFDLQLKRAFPDIVVIDPSDDKKRAIVRCWFYNQPENQCTENSLGDPDDDLTVVVVNSRKF
jgi:hypothetical protein